MRWHGFGKANYKGLKQKARTWVAPLTNQGRVPAEIVDRDRGPMRANVQSLRAEPVRAFSNGHADDSVRLALGR